MYVVDKDLESGTVYVANCREHPALYCDELEAESVHWISGKAPISLLKDGEIECQYQTRYHQAMGECKIRVNQYSSSPCIKYITVSMRHPQRVVTTGQIVAFYDRNVCLGSAIIKKPGPSYHACNLTLPSTLVD